MSEPGPVFGPNRPNHPGALDRTDIHQGLRVIMHRRGVPVERYIIESDPTGDGYVTVRSLDTGETERKDMAVMGLVPHDVNGRALWNQVNYTTLSPIQDASDE